MDYRVLYYPDFEPDPTWLRRILMVCDGVIRIVPTDVILDDPDDVKRLQDAVEGGLDRISPEAGDTAVEYADRDRLSKSFRALAERLCHAA